MFLATQLVDEARHIDVFLKRARAGGGGLGISSVTTSRSLLSLLELEDFTEAAFLLSVLGEGTFLDLLRFVETPRARRGDPRAGRGARAPTRRATSTSASRTCATRSPPILRLRAARSGGAPPRGHAGQRRRCPRRCRTRSTLLAAGATDPASVARGHHAFRELLDEMHEGRIKRLQSAGFSRRAGAPPVGAAHAELHVARSGASSVGPSRCQARSSRSRTRPKRPRIGRSARATGRSSLRHRQARKSSRPKPSKMAGFSTPSIRPNQPRTRRAARFLHRFAMTLTPRSLWIARPRASFFSWPVRGRTRSSLPAAAPSVSAVRRGVVSRSRSPRVRCDVASDPRANGPFNATVVRSSLYSQQKSEGT